MPIGPTSGFLDFTNATPRANVIVALSNIGIGTDVPLHAFDLRGTANVADMIVNNDLTLTGGLTTNSLTINSMSMSTTSNFQQVTNVGNVTTNTVEFTNPTTGLTVTSNVEVGGELSVGGNVEVSGELSVSGSATVSQELSVSGNVEVGTANLFVDTTTGNVGVGTTEPQAKLDVVTSSTSSDVFMRIDASSITNTGYSEIQMTGPGGNNQQLCIFCNGSGRTADGGASATTIRNNVGPIILGHSSYVNRIRRPKDDDFICGKWTTTLDASASTTVITNLRSCVSTPAATGGNMSGNIGRFTAPEDGYYYACCQVVQATKNNSNLLIVYDANGTNFATNNPNIGTYDEIIDLRGVDNVEETYNKVFVMHMEQDDYIQFRVHSSGYTDSSTYKMQCYAYLLNRI
jgi:hypothetical protein